MRHPISLTGGCQCGAVRFSCERLGRASICHCRMCQKAFGSIGGPLVSGFGLTWTRGAPTYFQSSNKVKRGFCNQCGTPLTYEFEGHETEVAIGAFDHAADIPPVIQIGLEGKLPWFDQLHGLPTRTTEEDAKAHAIFAQIVSNQHPDHDTP